LIFAKHNQFLIQACAAIHPRVLQQLLSEREFKRQEIEDVAPNDNIVVNGRRWVSCYRRIVSDHCSGGH
jgi:hypothetical protein